ncbi:helix-turn-helix domain-containing protein [Nannocystaceae bacterium ST9]
MARARRSAAPSKSVEPNEAPAVLNAKQVAELLGVNRKTVYEAAQLGRIPHRRLGRLLLFERGAVLAWLRSGVGG